MCRGEGGREMFMWMASPTVEPAHPHAVMLGLDWAVTALVGGGGGIPAVDRLLVDVP